MGMRCHWCQKPLESRSARHVCATGPKFVGFDAYLATEEKRGACDWQAKVEGDVVVVVSRTSSEQILGGQTRKQRDLLALEAAGVLAAALLPGGIAKAIDHGLVAYVGDVERWWVSEYHVRVREPERLQEPRKALEPAAIDRVEGSMSGDDKHWLKIVFYATVAAWAWGWCARDLWSAFREWWPKRRCSVRIGEYGPRCTRWAVEYCPRCHQSRCEEHRFLGFYDFGDHVHGSRANKGQRLPPVATA